MFRLFIEEQKVKLALATLAWRAAYGRNGALGPEVAARVQLARVRWERKDRSLYEYDMTEVLKVQLQGPDLLRVEQVYLASMFIAIVPMIHAILVKQNWQQVTPEFEFFR